MIISTKVSKENWNEYTAAAAQHMYYVFCKDSMWISKEQAQRKSRNMRLSFDYIYSSKFDKLRDYLSTEARWHYTPMIFSTKMGDLDSILILQTMRDAAYLFAKPTFLGLRHTYRTIKKANAFQNIFDSYNRSLRFSKYVSNSLESAQNFEQKILNDLPLDDSRNDILLGLIRISEINTEKLVSMGKTELAINNQLKTSRLKAYLETNDRTFIQNINSNKINNSMSLKLALEIRSKYCLGDTAMYNSITNLAAASQKLNLNLLQPLDKFFLQTLSENNSKDMCNDKLFLVELKQYVSKISSELNQYDCSNNISKKNKQRHNNTKLRYTYKPSFSHPA